MSKLRKILTGRELSLTFGTERRIWVTALVFVVLLSVFEWFTLGNGFPQLLQDLYKSEDPLVLVIAAAYISASLYLFFVLTLVTLASKWRYRLVYIFIFGVATAAEYSYSRALGRFSTYYDVVSAVGVTRQQANDSLFAYINWTFLVPLVCLIAICVAIRRVNKTFGVIPHLLLVLVLCGFYVHLFYINSAFFDRQFVSNSFGSFSQTIADFAILDPFGSMKAKVREEVKSPLLSADMRPDNNIIFIFDESVKGDHLSLNGYSRPTTPYLEELYKKGVMKNWGIAVSASTISRPSYDAMIVGATPEILEKGDFNEINSMPTVFQYAKAMNYRTRLIDGQMSSYWAGIADDERYIDDLITMNELDSPDRVEDYQRPGAKITNESDRTVGLKQWDIDPKIAKIVNEMFTTSTGNFVFIYKRGVHFPYEKNYPESDAVWKPVYHFKEQYEIPSADQHQAIVNSYDNALKYNLDDFFKRLAPDYSDLPNNTIIVYTSDHGESFFADGKAGHGGITREEATVPLFIFGLKDKSPDVGFKATHANIFSALLDLMNFPRELRKYSYQMSLFDGNSTQQVQRFYNPPTGKKYAFDQ